MEDKIMLPRLRTFSPSLVDNFFNNDFFDNFISNHAPVLKSSMPAINIIESKENFRIEIANPGLDKEDFKIDLHNDLLTISGEKKSENEEKDEKYMRKEFNYTYFKRSFILPDSANAENIEATHKNGILTVTINKKEESKEKEPRQISVN
jgi:HSP20 family protein